MHCMFSSRGGRRLVAACALTLACVATLGCGGKKQVNPMASVRGKVLTPSGDPLTEGMVNLNAPDIGVGASEPVGSDGTFKIPADIRTGKYIITITPPAPPPPDPTKRATPPDLSKFKDTIPMKYRDARTTPFKDQQIKEGKNDLELKMEK